jgi:hypothetical protein
MFMYIQLICLILYVCLGGTCIIMTSGILCIMDRARWRGNFFTLKEGHEMG